LRFKPARPSQGVLIDFEGIDGCGKTTQVRLLAARLREAGRPVTALKEPTQEPHGRELWAMLRGERDATADEIHCLFVADRRQHVAERIAPALASGEVVLMDRYYYSNLAYQGAAGLSTTTIKADNAYAPAPVLVLVFDLPVAVALARVGAAADRFERADHLVRVRAAYQMLADDPLVRLLDATQSPEALAEEVWSLVAPLLEAEGQA